MFKLLKKNLIVAIEIKSFILIFSLIKNNPSFVLVRKIIYLDIMYIIA